MQALLRTIATLFVTEMLSKRRLIWLDRLGPIVAFIFIACFGIACMKDERIMGVVFGDKRSRCPTIYSHRGSGIAGELEGSIPSLEALAAKDICHFDLDVFRCSSGELLAGHPDAESIAALSRGRHPEKMSRYELEPIPTLEDALRTISASCPRRTQLPSVTVELKGAAADIQGVRDVARLSTIVDSVSIALVVGGQGEPEISFASREVKMPVVLAVRSRDRNLPPRLTLAEVEDRRGQTGSIVAVAPAVSLLVNAAAVSSDIANKMPPLLVWVVDDVITARAAVAAGATALISNRPVDISAELGC